MKICVYGAGAIGGYLGFLLYESGADVTLIARGPHLEAMQSRGLSLLVQEGSDWRRRAAEIPCTDDPRSLGAQDFVILTLKAHSTPAIVDAIGALLDDATTVVTAQNGVPWWYFYRFGGELEGRRIESVDPGGVLWRRIGPERVLGCVVYPSTELVEPGVVRHLHGNRFMLGEPDGSRSERAIGLSAVLAAAGLKAPVRSRIRDDVWLKLWGNVSFNPVSVLTGRTLEEMVADGASRALLREIMLEAKAVAERLGARFAVDVDRRLRWGAEAGAHKTSMLQDWEAGRKLETDALVAAVAELGDLVAVETPTIDRVLARVRRLEEQAAGDGRGR